MHEKTVIYYYSGTGNSLSVARQVAPKLGDTDFISIYNLEDMLRSEFIAESADE